MINQVRQAIRGGLDHLVAAQQGDSWRGFSTLAGVSDVWVTAFMVAHLQRVPGRPPLGPAKAWLRAQSSQRGMWSYGGNVPPDADSTAWCLIALSGARDLPAAQRRLALQGIWQQQVDSGIATYAADGAIAKFIGVGAEQSMAGWTAAHPDVTATAVIASTIRSSAADRLAAAPESLLARLISRQTAAGFFDAYWWRGSHYTTTLVLRALAACARRLETERARRILHALEREQLADGGFGLGASLQMDPFTTALALESLTHLAWLGGARIRRTVAKALIGSQAGSGAWSGDFILRIPSPGVVDPRQVAFWTRESGGGNSYVRDREGQFASVMACFALQSWLDVELGETAARRNWPVLAAASAGLELESSELVMATAA